MNLILSVSKCHIRNHYYYFTQYYLTNGTISPETPDVGNNFYSVAQIGIVVFNSQTNTGFDP